MQALLNEFLERKSNISEIGFIHQVEYLAYFYTKITRDSIFTYENVKTYFEWAQLPEPKNIPDMFNKLKAKGIFLPNKNGFVLNREEIKRLDQEFSQNKPKIQAAKSLRDLLPKIANTNENSFLSEAISCFEVGAYRSTIIMVWLLTLDHLFDYILKNKINEFNNALVKQNLKVKKISNKEDFSEMKEEKFIEICRSAGIVTNDIRKILDEKLGIRNSCAHPNNILVKEAKAINFVEDLIENVVLRY